MSATRAVLVVGATGSVGRLVVDEALRQGYRVRALVPSRDRARGLPATAEVASTEEPQRVRDDLEGVVVMHIRYGTSQALGEELP
jgi:uncharacterized protein YbjT (DUF2867 family)